MKFLLDNNLPPKLARAIHQLVEGEGHSVVALRDRFSADAVDEEWIRLLDREGDWVVISRDRYSKRMTSGAVERELLRGSSLVVFVLDKGWRAFHDWELAWRLIRWWPTLQQTAMTIEGGVGYRVPKDYRAHLKQKLQLLWSHSRSR